LELPLNKRKIPFSQLSKEAAKKVFKEWELLDNKSLY
jgi:hypothetical protein